MNMFAQAWKGEAPLWKAFWLVYVVVGIIVGIIIAVIVAYAVAPGATPTANNDLIMTIGFPYTLFSAICVWRCGKNSAMVWNVLSKILVILSVIGGVMAALRVFHIM